ncbi:hypothetical protein ASG29_09135 [Sphingomonas sp. Leaf412]|uniref:hypothetical protein n=1 Tax=Sphingomonas sp. Leaf412 TaxID=1736370 RepID=UPI0006F45FBB|nr:hypothetical protein [Sphingomonas sp. Leaf412]KQT32012.1 hypothetical protein ASG29_09135 [Sphingomonas sp. Leaf412]
MTGPARGRVAPRRLLAAGAILAAGAGAYLATRPGDVAPSRGITVVRGTGTAPARPVGPPVAAAPSSAAPDARSADGDIATLRRNLAATFPTLGGATIVCTDRCELSAAVSEAGDARVAPSQLPYLGRLEAYLRRNGYRPIDALMIEEAGGGDSVLRLRFARG